MPAKENPLTSNSTSGEIGPILLCLSLSWYFLPEMVRSVLAALYTS